MLDRLAEIGMTIAESVGREVIAGPPPVEAPDAPAQARPVQFYSDLALAFDRTSRAVRQTIGLYDRMTAPPRGKGAVAQAGAEADEGEWCLEDMLEDLDRQDAMLARLQVEVGAAARAAGHDEQAIERLVRQGREGLGDADDICALMKRRSSDQIIARVCHDLGLPSPLQPSAPDLPLPEEPLSEAEAASRELARRNAEYIRRAEEGPDGWSPEDSSICEWTGKRRNGWP